MVAAGTGIVIPHLAPNTSLLAGNCDIDVDECESSPCRNGATCTESSVESSVSFHAYQCTCVAGFANGVCEYDGDARERADPPYGFIVEYTAECTVMESSSSTCEDDASWTDSTGTGCDGYGDNLALEQVPCALAGSLAGDDGRTALVACCVARTPTHFSGTAILM